jgi:hypothetical protein
MPQPNAEPNADCWFCARKKSFHIEQTQGFGCYTTKRKSGRLNGTTGHFQTGGIPTMLLLASQKPREKVNCCRHG